MATQKGTVAGVFGIPGSPSLTIGDADPVTVLRTYNYSKEADSKSSGDNDGDAQCVVFYNTRERLSVDIVVHGADQAAALASFVDMARDPSTLCELTGITDTQVVTAGDTTNDWILETVSRVASQDDFGTCTVNLVRYANDLDTVS